tara:strand:+ start:37224 stop:37670 length:447 start_codon:yes stop_codon:yes gene_type:complete
MSEATRDFLAKTMVFQHGNETVIWGIPLNTLEIDEHELDEYLADGWHAHPFDARDAQAALEAQQAEAERIKAEQAAAEKKRLEDEAAENQRRLDEEAKTKLANDNAARLDNELKERLLVEAKELGISVDGRWGTKTIQEAIDEAKKAK